MICCLPLSGRWNLHEFLCCANLQIVEERHSYERVCLGRLPIMLKSFYCWTHDIAAEQLPDVGECSYDQGGYFIINGSEKVGRIAVYSLGLRS